MKNTCKSSQYLVLRNILSHKIFHQSPISSPPIEVSTDSICTMDADGSGNKRLTEKSEEKDKTAYRLVQIGPNTICCFLSFGKGCFLETQIKRAGGQLRSLQKNQNPYVSFVECLECQLLLYLYASLYPFISVFSMSEAR